MRYERKYLLEDKKLYVTSCHLNSIGFYKEYPTRKVNSIYYDTYIFDLFNSSEAGYSDRSKIRIRWYDISEKQHLEYKIKEAELGKKNYENNISNFDNLKKISIINTCHTKFDNRKIPNSINSIYYPKVSVSYKRDYLYSEKNLTRLTLDYDIKFGKILNYGDKYIINNWIPSENSVLEIKYNKDTLNELFISKAIEKLKLNLSRFSKYCQAVHSVY